MGSTVRSIVLAAQTLVILFAEPGFAQFPIPRGLNDKVGAVTGKMRDVELTQAEEVALGQEISARVRARYGVVQDPEIHKYVSLVGSVLARKTPQTGTAWHFIVLDTDGVNAFAAPGGFVHITRGSLALMKSEAELAGVLSHELAHVTLKHTVRAIQKNKLVQMGVKDTNVKSNPEVFKRLVDEGTRAVSDGSQTPQSAAVTGSGGSCGVDVERSAKGGGNPNPVAITPTESDITGFVSEGNLRP